MGKVLLFGGLTLLGQPIIDQLLNSGHEVIAVRTLSDLESPTIEEYIEMLFGRNALFQSVQSDWKQYANQVETVIFLDTASFLSDTDFFVTPDIIQDRLKFILEEGQVLKNIIVVSHIDIYGNAIGRINEQTPVAPHSNRGHQVDEVERGLIESLLLNKDKARVVSAFIVRVPNIYTQYGTDYGESLHVEDAATGISALINTEQAPGIVVLQLASGRKFGMTQYSYEKARQLINFEPVKTLKIPHTK